MVHEFRLSLTHRWIRAGSRWARWTQELRLDEPIDDVLGGVTASDAEQILRLLCSSARMIVRPTTIGVCSLANNDHYDAVWLASRRTLNNGSHYRTLCLADGLISENHERALGKRGNAERSWYQEAHFQSRDELHVAH